MRISDWSSDVCSSDLLTGWLFGLLTDFSAPGWLADLAPWRSTHVLLAANSAMCLLPLLLLREPERREVEASPNAPFRIVAAELSSRRAFPGPLFEIGRASCRERVCQYG